MADKFRKTFPIRITFGAGEQPTSNKLTAIGEQARNGQRLIEYAIGDVWGQSGDSLLIDYPVQIPNLARAVGEQHYLNPAYFPLNRTFLFYDTISDRYPSKNTGILKFRPLAWVAGGLGHMGSTPPVTNEWDVDGTNDWWWDTETGRFTTYNGLAWALFGLGDAVQYTVDPPNDWIMSQETVPGIIPDPRQTDFTSCRIEKSGSKFYLHLPPRMPLTFSGNTMPANYPLQNLADFLYNYDTSVQDPPKLFGVASGNIALVGPGSAAYRYVLPAEIQTLFSSPGAGAIVPEGAMYLWDQAGQTVIEDITFIIPDASFEEYTLEVESSTYDFDAVASADETETSYNDTGLTLITCGAPLARSVWNQMNMFLSHSHNNSGSLEPPLMHNDLGLRDPPNHVNAEHSARYPTYLPPWPGPRWNDDPHTSLLSRAGTQSDSARVRDRFNNAMLGHFLLANASSSNFLDGTCPNYSYRIWFGDYDLTNAHNIGVNSSNTLTMKHGASDVAIGIDDSATVGIGTTQPQAKFHIASSDALVDTGLAGVNAHNFLMTNQLNSIGLAAAQNVIPSVANYLMAKRSRGTLSTPTDIQAGDSIFNIVAQGYLSGSAYTAAEIRFSAGSVVSSQVSGEISFRTGNGTSSPSERWVINKDGNFVPGNSSLYIGASARHVDKLYVHNIDREDTGELKVWAHDGDLGLYCSSGDFTLQAGSGNGTVESQALLVRGFLAKLELTGKTYLELTSFSNDILFKTGTTPTTKWKVENAGNFIPEDHEAVDIGDWYTNRVSAVYTTRVQAEEVRSGPGLPMNFMISTSAIPDVTKFNFYHDDTVALAEIKQHREFADDHHLMGTVVDDKDMGQGFIVRMQVTPGHAVSAGDAVSVNGDSYTDPTHKRTIARNQAHNGSTVHKYFFVGIALEDGSGGDFVRVGITGLFFCTVRVMTTSSVRPGALLTPGNTTTAGTLCLSHDRQVGVTRLWSPTGWEVVGRCMDYIPPDASSDRLVDVMIKIPA